MNDNAHDILRQGRIKILQQEYIATMHHADKLRKQIEDLGGTTESLSVGNPWFGEDERASYFGPVQDIGQGQHIVHTVVSRKGDEPHIEHEFRIEK